MKKIGIIFAMDEEINAFKESLNIQNEYDIFDLHFYEVEINNTLCMLVTSGVGKVNAARTTQILIDNYGVDLIINVGVAGGVNINLNVLDIVVGEKLVQHDFDITAFNHEKGYIPKVGVYINSDEYLVKLACDVLEKEKVSYHKGIIASGDIFCTEEAMSSKISKKFNALCVEMEGASIAQVCYLSHIPFIVIRSISDVPNNDNVMVYEEFLEKSSKIVATALLNIIKNIDV
jgi:adenosylhomocysteine nucleosidase